jgi:chromosome segregation ATPase
MLPLISVASLALLLWVFGVAHWLSISVLGVPAWGWVTLVAILFGMPNLRPLSADIAHLRRRLQRARQRHQRVTARLQEVEEGYDAALRNIETRSNQLASGVKEIEQQFGEICGTVESVVERVDFLNERVTTLETPGAHFFHDESEQTATVCLHCLYEALVEGTRNPAELSRAARFEETKTEHYARVHPDEAATKARRAWLEQEAERILTAGQPLT